VLGIDRAGAAARRFRPLQGLSGNADVFDDFFARFRRRRAAGANGGWRIDFSSIGAQMFRNADGSSRLGILSRRQQERAISQQTAEAAEYVARHGGYLAAHTVEKTFGGRKVVKGASLYVRRGEAVGLLGPNGAGKTTIFYIITGLIAADRGRIELDGFDVTPLPMYQRARLGIGYLPQEASIFRGLTVEENIRAVLEVVEPDRRQRERELSSLLEEFNIARLRRSPSIASAAASRLHARWPRGRTSCCSTSRSPASIRLLWATFSCWSGTSPTAVSGS
jgi:hypothetical protein